MYACPASRLQFCKRFVHLHRPKELSSPLRCSLTTSPSYQNTIEFEHNPNPNRTDKDKRGYIASDVLVGVCGGLLLSAWLGFKKSNEADCATASGRQLAIGDHECDRRFDRLPTYRFSDVGKHYEPSTRIWVSYRHGVYDITDFLDKHPGGERLMMAAGGSLETFWELYPVHKKEEVYKVLAQYRIGNLHLDDVEEAKSQVQSMPDTFAGDPARNALLKPRSVKPFNGETPPVLLTAGFHTANDIFFVRNHMHVPAVDLATYSLEIGGLSFSKAKNFTLDEIKKLPKKEISATIQCGGNRRIEMNTVKPVQGLSWTGGAIGNAKWSGAKLIDVLKLCGFDWKNYPEPRKLHLQFEGMDSDVSGEAYCTSIPLSYLKDDSFEAIVAYEMNDKPIPIDHGFPLRVIVPGIVGSRNVKWLAKITISDEEAQSPWQRRDYKVFSPSMTLETVDYDSSPAIQDTPVTSYLCSHEENQTVAKGNSVLEGYAFSGGGRGIVRVEVSLDEGKTWNSANITSKDENAGSKSWSWVLWKYKAEFAKPGKQSVWVRAVDTGYNQQSENMANIWNYRGLLTNAYHKISVNVT